MESNLAFLCDLKANTYGVIFLEFEIKDYDTKTTFFHIGVNVQNPTPANIKSFPRSADDIRTISYDLPISVLKCSFISTR